MKTLTALGKSFVCHLLIFPSPIDSSYYTHRKINLRRLSQKSTDYTIEKLHSFIHSNYKIYCVQSIILVLKP